VTTPEFFWLNAVNGSAANRQEAESKIVFFISFMV